jgi:rhomboid protease GluP
MQPASGFGKRGGAPAGYAPTPPHAEPWTRAPGPRETAWVAGPEPAPAAKVAPTIDRGLPVLTVGLLALLAVIFCLENLFALSPAAKLSPGWATQVALGADGRDLVVRDGEWWRMVTACLLHGSPEHIIGNSVVLFFTGWYLERLIGRAWFGATFVIAGLGGSIAALLMNPHDMIGVGASGAIMGLLAAAFICSFHVEAYEGRGKAQRRIAFQVLPALIPSHSSGGGGAVVDYSAHAGGAIAGVALGFLILALWPENQARPVLRRWAMGVGLAGALAAVASGVCVAAAYPAHKARVAGFIPDNEDPKTYKDMVAQSARLVATYPRDPRAHFYRAIYYEMNRNLDGAIGELQLGLNDPAAFGVDTPPQTRPYMQLILADALMEKGRRDEARRSVGGACDYPFFGQAPTKLIRELQDQDICPEH